MVRLWGRTNANFYPCSRLMVASASPKISFMLPLENRSCWMPNMLEKSSVPSSTTAIALVNPNRPWKRPSSCTTFCLALISSSAVSSSPVMTRKAIELLSNIDSKISLTPCPALAPISYASTGMLCWSCKWSLSSLHRGLLPCPINTLPAESIGLSGNVDSLRAFSMA